MLRVFGIVLPIRRIALRNPAFLPGYRGVALVLIAVFGYLLTDMGHYGLFSSRIQTKLRRTPVCRDLESVLGLIVECASFLNGCGEVRSCHLPSSCH
jgi:hypothetical protein